MNAELHRQAAALRQSQSKSSYRHLPSPLIITESKSPYSFNYHTMNYLSPTQTMMATRNLWCDHTSTKLNFHNTATYSDINNDYDIQESCAITKQTDRTMCPIQYIGALKIFGTPWLCPRLLFPTFFMAFCSGRPYEWCYKSWSQ